MTRAPSLARQPRRRGADGRIRLGYLSGDFREHPVAQAVAGLLRHHDRSRFEVIAYSYGEDDRSPWRQRVIDASDRFVDLRWIAEDDAARQIHDDGTDVLIDLTLWTHGARPRIAALRPAPIQVQYLGFPGTSGAPNCDYAIVDPIVVPAEDRPHWSESLVLLPACYFVTDDSQKIGATGMTRAQCGLPQDAVVFCSFNQTMKIDRATFGLWMTILLGVPGSVLWLPTLGQVARDNMMREARRLGVEESRLIFAARTDTKEEHLERLGLADLALDTLRYNGHMTTSDALWAGIPVVATIGCHFASRVSASMLKTMALDELVAADRAGYVDLAIALGLDDHRRAEIRSRVAAARRHASLFDTQAITRDLERAFEAMVAQYRAGRRPAAMTL